MDYRSPLANPNLSTTDTTDHSFRVAAEGVFKGNPNLIHRTGLDAFEAALARGRKDLAARQAKVEALSELVGNLGASSYLSSGSGGSLAINAQKLEAEVAACNHLKLVVAGLERALEWRKANPIGVTQ